MNLHFIPISDLKDDNVSIYSQYKENQLVHYNEPELGLFIAESPKVIFRALDAGYEPVSFLVEDKTIESREASELWEKLREMTSQEDFRIPVYVGDMKLLSQITGFKLAHVRGQSAVGDSQRLRQIIHAHPSVLNKKVQDIDPGFRAKSAEDFQCFICILDISHSRIPLPVCA